MAKMRKEGRTAKSTNRELSTAKESSLSKAGAATGKRAPNASTTETPERDAGEKVVQMDRRRKTDRRASGDRRKLSEPVAVERRKLERRVKVNRRRQIDPTTCERDYSDEEVEFMNALDEYKRQSGRMFPTCSEILEVIRGLGYSKTLAPPVGDIAVGPVEQAELAVVAVAPATIDQVSGLSEIVTQA